LIFTWALPVPTQDGAHGEARGGSQKRHGPFVLTFIRPLHKEQVFLFPRGFSNTLMVKG
jgi:hypothetical protein